MLDRVVSVPQRAIITWALECLFHLQPEKQFYRTAEALGSSILGSCAADGYPQGCTGANGTDPALVYLAQTFRGLLESGILSQNRSWIVAAYKGAQRLLESFQQQGTLAGRYGPGWRADYSFNCMAGCAQTALLWLRLYQHGFAEEYFHAATQVARFITSTIDTASPDPGIRGGIRAGYPLWIDYHPLAYSTMAAKLALDVFLLLKKLSPPEIASQRLLLKRPAESGRPEGGTECRQLPAGS